MSTIYFISMSTIPWQDTNYFISTGERQTKLVAQHNNTTYRWCSNRVW